jgi:hypothetical protein
VRHLKIPLTLIALVGLIALTGCGGSDDSTSSASSAEEYGQQLQAILTEFGNSFDTQAADLRSAQSADDFSSAVDGLKAATATATEDLDALDPPADVQAAQDEFVAAFDALSTSIDDLSNADLSDRAATQAAVQSFTEAGAQFKTALEAAQQTLQEIGEGLDTTSTTG